MERSSLVVDLSASRVRQSLTPRTPRTFLGPTRRRILTRRRIPMSVLGLIIGNNVTTNLSALGDAHAIKDGLVMPIVKDIVALVVRDH